MSAIGGVIGLDGQPFGGADLAGMRAALAPLGPDGSGEWSGRVGPLGVAVTAARRRRTPEDASDRQPAFAVGGTLAVVGDLRIDNRAELAAALGVRDGPDLADSALVLAAYERWGEHCIERLVGAFAFALLDLRRGGVLLARDHLGLQPLVVHERPGVVAFASNALSLTRLDGVGHRLDTRRAAEVLALAYHSERTMVEGVRWLPPAGAMWVGGGGIRRWTWWRPDLHTTRGHDPPEVFERELRDALDRAVAARLRSAGPVGAMTSGGIDSTSVAATAAGMLAPQRLRTYTAAPPPGWSAAAARGWDADESPLVLELATLHPNIEPSVVHVERAPSILGVHERLWELGGGPERNPCNALWIHALMQRAAAHGVTTLLTGARGNYFFSAAGERWLVALLRAGRPAAFLRELNAWSRTTGRPRRLVVRGDVLAPLQPPRLARVRRRRRGEPDPVAGWLAETALRPETAAGLDLARLRPALDDSRRADPREVTFVAALTGGAQAETGLAAEALFGIETRDPTADRRLIEAALRQPEWVRRHDGIGRAVARSAMADRLPASIARRRRRGEQLPDWLDVMTAARGELTEEVEAIAEHEPSRELIDVARLRQLVAAWPDRLRNADPETVRDYRLALPRAVMLSRYLRWFERRALEDRAAVAGDRA